MTPLHTELGRAMNLHAITRSVLREGLWLWFRYCILSGAAVLTVPFPLRNKKLFTCYFPWGRNSSVGIATRYELDGQGVEFRWG